MSSKTIRWRQAMADDYKVKVEIKLVKCGEAVTDALV